MHILFAAFKPVLLILLLYLCLPSAGYAQIYRVYRPQPATEEKEKTDGPLNFEASASAVWTMGKLNDLSGQTISRRMMGPRIRLLSLLSEQISIGAEGQWLQAEDMPQEFFDKLQQYSFAGILRYNLTPQTRPFLYILLGGGWNFRRVDLSLPVAENKIHDGAIMWTAGVGIEWPLARRWEMGGEYRFFYEPKPWRNFIMEADSSFRHEWALYVSFLF